MFEDSNNFKHVLNKVEVGKVEEIAIDMLKQLSVEKKKWIKKLEY